MLPFIPRKSDLVNDTSNSPGQLHLNSDAKIADEGRPQGAPLPIVLSRRYALGRAPTRGAPTSRRLALGRAPTRGAPTDCLLSALCPGEGTHKGCPYRLSSLGGMPWEGHPQGVPLLGGMPWEGHPQGAPLPIVFSRRYALGRAPARGAPTDCLLSAVCPLGRAPTRGAPTSAFCPGKGTHKGRPYRLSSLGVLPWEGRPQGAPLPIVFSRRYALGRAPTRGAPTDCLLSAVCPGEGTHKGCPYLGGMPWEGHPQGAPLPIVFSRRYALGRAPTRGAPTDCLLSAVCPGKGTHKGRPYRLSSLGGMPWGGHPQGVPLPIVVSRRYALGRAPTRGAPTDCLLSAVCPLGRAPTRGAPTSAVCPGKGTHKGCPYRLSSLGGMPWGGHPQGVPLPIVFSRRYALGRAPTRGAPTRFRQPHVGLSQFDAIALDTSTVHSLLA